MNDHYKNITAFLADQDVGFEAVKYVLEKYPEHIKCVITISNNEISNLARSFGCQTFCYDEITLQNAKSIFDGVGVIFLAWWPKLIPGHIIDAPKIGVVNFHPSLLPYNRGKNYNFWTIVEETPFGTSLHFVDKNIDSGDILFQSSIEKSWEDTGGTLYLKARKEMLSLFKARYIDIIEGRYTRTKQNLEVGQVHYFKELEMASRISLDDSYSTRALLNLLRARTFEGKPACYFIEDGKKYEVRISISEVSNESN